MFDKDKPKKNFLKPMNLAIATLLVTASASAVYANPTIDTALANAQAAVIEKPYTLFQPNSLIIASATLTPSSGQMASHYSHSSHSSHYSHYSHRSHYSSHY